MLARIMDKIEVGVCWEWTAQRDPAGYGRVKYEGRPHLAHRVVWKELTGQWPKDTLDHVCHNKSCVNPDHLEDVALSENIKRSRRGSCAMGHPLEGDNLYMRPDRSNHRQCRACNRRAADKYRSKS